jgi:4-hydroxybutyryl-CoA dehydratase / vinylacetyl-CoA-Delta-isomerase
MEGGSIDPGNREFGGQEAMIIFEDVFIPNEHVFMDGEVDFAALLVERFTCYHRRSYVCKSGVGDVLIGAPPPSPTTTASRRPPTCGTSWWR